MASTLEMAGAQSVPSITPPSQIDLDAAIREGKKPDRVIPTPGSLIQRKQPEPRVFEADVIEGINEKEATARGNVVMNEGNQRLYAELVQYDENDDLANVPGSLRMLRGTDLFEGNALKLTVGTQKGTMDQVNFAFDKSPDRPTQRYAARGGASRMDFEGPEKERLFDARYTTCKPDEDEWYLWVGELSLDRLNNLGTGYNGRVEFQGVPILYVPFISFALNNQRQSGLLSPTIGQSTSNGLEWSVPYYFNIAPDLDSTLTPKWFSKRGLQLGSEVRYLNPLFFGEFDAEYLHEDRRADRSRYFTSLKHYQNLAPSLGTWLGGPLAGAWSAAINAQKVSDDAYFRDLSTRVASTAQTNLPRDVSLSYLGEWGNLTTRHLSFQTLQDPLAPVATPYRLGPQISFSARPVRAAGLEFSTVGEYTDFLHPTQVNGRRWLIYPSAAWLINSPYGFVTPKIGYHATRYDLTRNVDGYQSQTRAVPILSVDSGVTYERGMDWGGESLTQTLEPRLFLLYVPFRDQSTIPLFSTSATDFNFAQIFNENVFVGGDRISDAKQVTAAITTRFIENLTGVERLRLGIGQRYYYQPQRATLASDVRNGVFGESGAVSGDLSRSDLLAAVSGQMSDSWTLDSSFQYSTSQSRFQRANVAARYNANQGRLINISYRYTRDSLKQIDVSTQWPFGRAAPGWTVLARANHSLADRRLLEGLAGVEYNQGCWEFRLLAHRFATATQQYSNSIQFQLELKGLSRLGINTFETFKQNISGYRRSDDRADLFDR